MAKSNEPADNSLIRFKIDALDLSYEDYLAFDVVITNISQKKLVVYYPNIYEFDYRSLDGKTKMKFGNTPGTTNKNKFAVLLPGKSKKYCDTIGNRFIRSGKLRVVYSNYVKTCETLPKSKVFCGVVESNWIEIKRTPPLFKKTPKNYEKYLNQVIQFVDSSDANELSWRTINKTLKIPRKILLSNLLEISSDYMSLLANEKDAIRSQKAMAVLKTANSKRIMRHILNHYDFYLYNYFKTNYFQDEFAEIAMAVNYKETLKRLINHRHYLKDSKKYALREEIVDYLQRITGLDTNERSRKFWQLWTKKNRRYLRWDSKIGRVINFHAKLCGVALFKWDRMNVAQKELLLAGACNIDIQDWRRMKDEDRVAVIDKKYKNLVSQEAEKDNLEKEKAGKD